MMVIVALVFLQVLNRYVFKGNIAWAQEVSNMTFVWMIFLGGAVGMRRNSHLAIDVFLAVLPPRIRRYWDAMVMMLVAVFLAAFVWIGCQFVGQSAQTTSTYLNWPMAYVYGVLPLAGLIMLYYALKHALRRLEGREESARPLEV